MNHNSEMTDKYVKSSRKSQKCRSLSLSSAKYLQLNNFQKVPFAYTFNKHFEHKFYMTV